MDIWQRLFLYSSALLGAILLLIAVMTLSNAENGQLTVESVAHMTPAMESFYEFIKWFIYPWMALALFMFFRFLRRLFGG